MRRTRGGKRPRSASGENRKQARRFPLQTDPLKRVFDEFNLPPLPVAEEDGTAYSVSSFPIRRGQTWTEAEAAFSRTRWNLLWSTSPAYRWPGGLLVGFEQPHHFDDLTNAIADLPADTLYAEPVSEVKFGDALPMSERDRGDEALTLLATLAFDDVIAFFLDIATRAALNTAILIAKDAAENPAPSGPWWRTYRNLPPVRHTSDDERALFIKKYADEMRSLLRSLLFEPRVARRVGRAAEERRDHRAYCMRERLIRSQEFAGLQRNARYARAKQLVIQDVIAPEGGGFSDSNFQRIMDKGKAVHARVSPTTPFCAE